MLKIYKFSGHSDLLENGICIVAVGEGRSGDGGVVGRNSLDKFHGIYQTCLELSQLGFNLHSSELGLRVNICIGHMGMGRKVCDITLILQYLDVLS